MLLVVVAGIFVAHRTRFGNRVYAIGGNATSANLMGISTRSATIRIYMLSTGLATLAGIVFPFIPGGLCAGGRRRRAGCDCLGGDRRYAAQRWRRYRAGNAVRGGDPGADSDLHQLDGTLSSWWTKIAIGILLFIFIALQRGLTVLWENRQNAAVTRVSGAGSR